MLRRVKKSKITSGLSDNRGQAVIEYTLMLVVIVSIVIAFTTQVVKPLNVWLNNYMGSYLQCLLEMGELPTIGGDDTAVADEGCNARYEAGTLANGRPPRGGSSGSSSNGGSGSSGSKSSGSVSDSDSGSGNGSGSRGTYAGSASRGGSRFINRGRRPSSGVESSTGAAGKTVEIALEGGGSGSFFRGSAGGNSALSSQKTRSVAITGMTEMERKRLERKASGEGKASIVTGEGFRQPVKKIAVQPPPKQTLEKEEEPFTIGNFIRILFIVAIIIAIVLFVGGQALQMSKSFEK